MFHDSSTAFEKSSYLQLFPVELPKTFANSRKREFVLGRCCAVEALYKLGGPIERTLFNFADDRLPVWPRGWIGSISHSPVGAISIVCKSSFSPVLGVDMHWMQDLPTDLSTFQFVASRSEYEVVGRLSLIERYALVFSAKESLYKALYPIVRKVFDFDAARVVEFSNGTITLKLGYDWNHIFRKNQEFIIFWNICRDHIFTVCQTLTNKS